MQQPLVHLYFFTVMEDLLDSDYSLLTLLKSSQSITKVLMFIVAFVDMLRVLYARPW